MENEVQKKTPFEEGYEDAIDSMKIKIKGEKFIIYTANLALHDEEDCIIEKLSDLFRYARHYKESCDILERQQERLILENLNEQRKTTYYKAVVKDLIIAEYEDSKE